MILSSYFIKNIKTKLYCNNGSNFVKKSICTVWLFSLLLCFQSSILFPASRTFIASGTFGAVVTGHPKATEVALKVLREGGNAVDAAVAAAFVLAVVDPSNSGLGGDGHALVYCGRILEAWDGSSPRFKNQITQPHIGVPTEVPLLINLHKKHGTLSLPQIMAPAIRLARDGFPVSGYFAEIVRKRWTSFKDAKAKELFCPNGRPIAPGEILKQPDLSRTLIEIARDNGASFIRGEIAAKIVEELRAKGVNCDISDLADYSPKVTLPIEYDFNEYRVYAVPPPASGIMVMALLDLLKSTKIDPQSYDFPEVFLTNLKKVLWFKHLYLASWDGDTKKFIKEIHKFHPPIANYNSSTKREETDETGNTTHLVVWDKNDNFVSMTLTLGKHFGTCDFSSFGFFFNNQGSNFYPRGARYPKNYPQNAGSISAKSPIAVFKNGKPYLIIGGAGANRIIANLGLILFHFLTNKNNLISCIHQPRLFISLEGKVSLEESINTNIIEQLKIKFPKIRYLTAGNDFWGMVNAIMRQSETFTAVADYRRDASAGVLTRNPEAKRTFQVELFGYGEKPIKQIGLIMPYQSPRQKSEIWKTIGVCFKKTVQDGYLVRLLTRFPVGVSGYRFLNYFDIYPALLSQLPTELDNPELWKASPKLSKIEKKFVESIPPHLKGEDLVQWLLIEIGYGIPYKRISGSMTAEQLLKKGVGDCSGKARLLRNVLLYKGIPCRLVGGIIFREGFLEKTHIWNEVYLNNKWVPVCTVNQIFGRIPSSWIIFRYGDETTIEGGGRFFFRGRELSK